MFKTLEKKTNFLIRFFFPKIKNKTQLSSTKYTTVKKNLNKTIKKNSFAKY